MKKIGYFITLCFLVSMQVLASPLSSIVPLNNGIVSPATSFNIILNGLIPTATYSVVCYVDSSYPFQYIMLGSTLSSTSSIISYSLNSNYVTQDQLMLGQNVVVINGSFTNPTTDLIVLTNLDQTNPFNVTNCFAIPIPVPGS